MFSVRHTATSDACFAVLTPEQRRQILRLIANIQHDPAPDNISKFTLYELGSMVTICRDHRGGWVVYHVDNYEIVVWSVGVGGPYVPLDP